jgi:hypothetical protein
MEKTLPDSPPETAKGAVGTSVGILSKDHPHAGTRGTIPWYVYRVEASGFLRII